MQLYLSAPSIDNINDTERPGDTITNLWAGAKWSELCKLHKSTSKVSEV